VKRITILSTCCGCCCRVIACARGLGVIKIVDEFAWDGCIQSDSLLGANPVLILELRVWDLIAFHGFSRMDVETFCHLPLTLQFQLATANRELWPNPHRFVHCDWLKHSAKPAELVVKLIWRKLASPPRTDCSVAFARWCQRSPHLIFYSQNSIWSVHPFCRTLRCANCPTHT